MKKTTAKIKEDLARLQEQLRQAETRDAERIGRIALKAGLGEIVVDERELQAAFEELADRFRSASQEPEQMGWPQQRAGAQNKARGGDPEAKAPQLHSAFSAQSPDIED
ncbi:TraC family protein (plasmid) [Agrobacterium sp. MA01]|uniref:TraC family protein n=1 Tax=Agrobacterium sp. MA01 TaxID=2664893 RepID=UPI00129B5A82|nr:TraC family protein [Agrobacterium sp. MA01]QGG93563.1 TraC family protein [Agrobacterium sp. MA01]